MPARDRGAFDAMVALFSARSPADDDLVAAEALEAEALELLDDLRTRPAEVAATRAAGLLVGQHRLPPWRAERSWLIVAAAHLAAGRLADAEAVQRRVVGALDAIPDGDPGLDRIRVEAVRALGAGLAVQGRYRAAARVLGRAVADATEMLGAGDAETGRSCLELGTVHRLIGRFDRADTLNRRALAVAEEAAGPEGRDAAAAWSARSELERGRGRLVESEQAVRRCLDLTASMFGPDHPQHVGVHAQLGNILVARGNHAGEAWLLRAYHFFDRRLGPLHYRVAEYAADLATALAGRGACRRAEGLFRCALASQETTFGPDHPQAGVTAARLAVMLARLGRSDEAAGLYRRAAVALQGAVEPCHPVLRAISEALDAPG